MDGEKTENPKAPPVLPAGVVMIVERSDGRIELAVLDEALDVYLIRSDITVIDDRGLPARFPGNGKPRKRK